MSGFWQAVLGMLGIALYLGIPLSWVVYLIWAPARRRVASEQGPEYARASARFHAKWGLVLSAPALVVGGFFIWAGAWAGWLTLAGTLGCWCLAIGVIRGRRIPSPFAWLPAVLPAVAVVSLASTAPSGEDPSTFVYRLVVFSFFGVGLAAWTVVGVNFALSVRGYNDYQPKTRALARDPRNAAWQPVEQSQASSM